MKFQKYIFLRRTTADVQKVLKASALPESFLSMIRN